jgi:hypothetical protein
MSFLRVRPSIAGVVLTEFDSAYSNPYQGGRFDNGSRVDAGGISRTAAVLAAALHRLAGGRPEDLKVRAAPRPGAGGRLRCAAALPSSIPHSSACLCC